MIRPSDCEQCVPLETENPDNGIITRAHEPECINHPNNQERRTMNNVIPLPERATSESIADAADCYGITVGFSALGQQPQFLIANAPEFHSSFGDGPSAVIVVPPTNAPHDASTSYQLDDQQILGFATALWKIMDLQTQKRFMDRIYSNVFSERQEDHDRD